MYGFIYITTNLTNNKRYVGRKKYSKGWENYLGSSKMLLADIKSLGVDQFKRDILEECCCKEELAKREIFWQQHFNVKVSSDFYNIVIASEGFDTSGSKYSYSDEQKRKIWNEQRRNVARSKWKDKDSNPNNLPHVKKLRSDRMKVKSFFNTEESRKLASRQNSKAFVLEFEGGDYYFENEREAANVFSISSVEYVKRCGYKKRKPFKGLSFKRWL